MRRKENHLPALYQQLFLLMNKFPGDLPKFRLALTMIIAHQRLRVMRPSRSIMIYLLFTASSGVRPIM
ncbi:p-hydroxybenzoic acid efflux subunit AaeB [Citrobacter koseri]|uniref:p-hydroxybenzoic acid efflux subunit AaeB n=1 Tax=Citrobacter koseri TaxID=545 RepID=A0A2X2WMZ7_CITKO|nr:p-hydroxybenzoic acid efflux subunit AaeB [Citrobacter koseri]